MMIARSALLRMVFMSCALAVFTVAVDSPHASTQASGPRPVLLVTDGGDGRRLVLRGGTREVGSIAVPPDVGRAALDAAISSALWHPNRWDVAISANGDTGSFVVVFLEQPNGTYAAVDVSRVERTTIGGIGPNRTYRVRRTRAVEWLADRQLEGPYAGRPAVQIRFRTEVWDEAGTRYAGGDVLIITRDGTPLWR
jgi:hypothetical protein